MYGKDEYHESEAERVIDQVRAMLDGLDEETRVVLRRRFPEVIKPGTILPFGESSLDTRSLVANQQYQAMNVAHQRGPGILGGLFGSLLR